ncbi:zinc transporter ZIP9-like [Hippocampus comes]|uniref:zinc transporter ZIP9-like n=1 Tax=Hippocampus comes TaxID=109280 RepID=UPI00094E6A9C|nr:PREDICTED: zinc transporter ZIP9-like [Hippocampus comes]
MDGGLSITLISVVMFVGSFLLGFIPLLFRLSERSLHLVSILGAGFLCGTALAITVPEGVGLMQESWTHQNASLSAGNDSSRESASSPQPWIGVALTSGFTFMFVVDQLASYFSVCGKTNPNSDAITATLGLVIHAAGRVILILTPLLYAQDSEIRLLEEANRLRAELRRLQADSERSEEPGSSEEPASEAGELRQQLLRAFGELRAAEDRDYMTQHRLKWLREEKRCLLKENDITAKLDWSNLDDCITGLRCFCVYPYFCNWSFLVASLSAGNDSSRESASSPQPWIGVALTSGFTFMFVVDQLASYFSVCGKTNPNSDAITATLGLVIHAAADGFALGAVVATGQVTVQVIVFLAVILHKAPAAFGLVAFLIHAGLEKRSIQGHLLAFSAAAPLVAIPTYFILHMTSSSPQNQLGATGVGMLFSGGTFLFVATVHVLPDIISSSSGSRAGQQSGHPKHQSHLGLKESVALVFGIALPVLLALGLHDD